MAIFGVKKTIKNAGWLVGGNVAKMLISFIVSIFTARFLGPSNKGLLDYALAYTGFFTAICTLGINSVLVKEFIDEREGEGTVLGTSLVLRVVAALCSAVTICCIVAIVDAGDTVAFWVALFTSLGLIFQIFEVFQYWFHAQLQSKFTSVILLIAYLVTAGYKILLLVLGKGVLWFALATSVDYICIAALLLVAYFKKGGKKLRFSWRYAKDLLKRSCHFILPSLMVAIYAQTDKFMLRQMISDAEIAYYSTASAVCTLWVFVLSAIIDSVHPSIMQAHKEENFALYEKRNKQLYATVFYLSVLVSVFFCIFADLIVDILYGEAYASAASPMRIITWYTAFSFLGVARGAWVICEDKQKYLIWVYVGGAVANVLVNLLLIPVWGANGAALASLIAQVVTAFVVPICIPALRPNAKLMWDAILLRGIFSEKTRARVCSFIKVAIVYLLAIGLGVMVCWWLPFATWLNLLIADVVATVVVFLYSLLFDNASVYDPYWSVQPIVIAVGYAIGKSLGAAQILPLIAVCLWGVRLTANWAYTFHGLQYQDWRYTHYQKKTGRLYPVVNFFGIHLMPTLIVYACVLPVVYLMESGAAFNPWSIAFFVVSLGATIWQGVADCQMHKFRKKGTGGFIRTGLWKYSRHPNYLGEILMWWGIGLFAVVTVPSTWYLLTGALVNTVLFLVVSIPLADGKQAQKEGFAEYKKETWRLLPLPKPVKK